MGSCTRSWWGLQRLSSRLAAVRARVTAAWDARRSWTDDGSKSAGARLARDAGLDPATATAEVRRARKLRRMPVVMAALVEGRLSVDYADLLARACTAQVVKVFERDESLLVNLITEMRFVRA